MSWKSKALPVLVGLALMAGVQPASWCAVMCAAEKMAAECHGGMATDAGAGMARAAGECEHGASVAQAKAKNEESAWKSSCASAECGKMEPTVARVRGSAELAARHGEVWGEQANAGLPEASLRWSGTDWGIGSLGSENLPSRGLLSLRI